MKNTPENIWANCLEFIKDNISEQSFKTWFLPIRPIKLKGQILHIQVPSKFFYEWIEEHYIKLLKTAIGRELGEDAKLVYSIVMENTYGNSNPYTVKIPSNNRAPCCRWSKKPFCNPWIEKGKHRISAKPKLHFREFY